MRWEVGSQQNLTYLIVAFIRGCGYTSMEEISSRLPQEFMDFAILQDSISRRRFMGIWLQTAYCN
jgi:hypothetical protein